MDEARGEKKHSAHRKEKENVNNENGDDVGQAEKEKIEKDCKKGESEIVNVKEKVDVVKTKEPKLTTVKESLDFLKSLSVRLDEIHKNDMEFRCHEKLRRLKMDCGEKLRVIKNKQIKMRISLNVLLEKMHHDKENIREKDDISLKEVSFQLDNCFSYNNSQKEPGNSNLDFKWKINNMRAFLDQQNGYQMTSPDFPLNGYSFEAQTRLTIENEKVAFALRFKDVVKAKEAIPFNNVPAVCAYFENDTEGRSEILRHHYLFTTKLKLGSFKYDTQIKFEKRILRPLMEGKDALTLCVFVEPQSVVRNVKSYNGSLTYFVEDWKNKMKNTVCHFSPYFYTSLYGYRVFVKLLVNVTNFAANGCIVLAQIQFEVGDFDAELPKKFAYRVTFTIFNEEDPSQCKTISTKDNLAYAHYCQLAVCEQETLQNFICNDRLFYKVTIEELFQ